MYNFLDFKELVSSNNSIVTNGDITSDTGWTKTDTAPIGLNEDTWGYSSGSYVNNNPLTTDWTQGLSQELAIKANSNYLFDLGLTSGGANDITFYILLIDGANYVTIHSEVVNATTEYVSIPYTPSQNYSKIMVVAYNSGGGASFVARVQYFNIYELATLFNNDCGYDLPLVKDDVVQAYTNFDIDNTEYAFSNLKLGLYSDGFYLYDIATLTQVVVSGDIYNVYFSWTVPQLPKGNYRFVLYEDTNNIHYISNSFRYTSNKEHTKILKYRNTIDTLGYLYETATTFYNQFRIDIYRGKPAFPNNSTGYQTYTGDFIRVKSDIQKTVEFVMGFASETILEAFVSALLHDEVYLDDVEYKKPDGENISINFSEEDLKIGTGTVNLLEVSYSKSIESC